MSYKLILKLNKLIKISCFNFLEFFTLKRVLNYKFPIAVSKISSNLWNLIMEKIN